MGDSDLYYTVVLAPAVADSRRATAALCASGSGSTAAAAHLGVWPACIGGLELGRRPNDELATRYRAWLNAA